MWPLEQVGGVELVPLGVSRTRPNPQNQWTSSRICGVGWEGGTGVPLGVSRTHPDKPTE